MVHNLVLVYHNMRVINKTAENEQARTQVWLPVECKADVAHRTKRDGLVCTCVTISHVHRVTLRHHFGQHDANRGGTCEKSRTYSKFREEWVVVYASASQQGDPVSIRPVPKYISPLHIPHN